MGGCVGNEKRPQNQPLKGKQADKAQKYAPQPTDNLEEVKATGKNSPKNVRFQDPPSHEPPKAAQNQGDTKDKVDGYGAENINALENDHPDKAGQELQNIKTQHLNVSDENQEQKRSPIKDLEEAHKIQQNKDIEFDEIKSLSANSKKNINENKEEAEPQNYPTHHKPQSKINVIYAPDIQQIQRQQRIQATQKRYNHLSNLKAVSQVPSLAQEMSSKKVQGHIKDHEFENTLDKENQRNKLIQQSAPASGKESTEKEAEPQKQVQPFLDQEERMHGEEQFLQAYQQGFQLPIFQIVIGN